MCSICREAKDESEFYYNKNARSYASYCRNCNRLYHREYKRIWRERKKENGLTENNKTLSDIKIK